MSSNFILFNPSLQNAYNDTTYAANSQLLNGVNNGLADPSLHNKLFYQSTMPGWAIGQFMKARGYNAQDANPTAYLSAFTAAFTPPQLPTGVWMAYMLDGVAPSGWVYMTGTIGSSSSNATNRANLDTQLLYQGLWNSINNTFAPVYESTGAPASSRGASWLSDWNANRAIAIPDMRGRFPLGKDDMGGTAALRVTSASKNGGNAIVLGGTGGEQTHLMTLAELVNHFHTYIQWSAGGGGNGTPDSGWRSITSNTSSTGGNTPFNVMPPWLSTNYIIKL